MQYYITDSQSGELIPVDEEVYLAWAADNNIETAQGDPVVGGVNKTSVSSTGVVTGSSTVVQPGPGFGTTSYVSSPGEPGEITAAQRAQLREDQRTAEALALTNAVWASLSGWNRGSFQEDTNVGGYPEPEVDDPQGPVVRSRDIEGAGIDDEIVLPEPDPAYGDFFDPDELRSLGQLQPISIEQVSESTINPNFVPIEERAIRDKTGIVVSQADWQSEITEIYQELRGGKGQLVQEVTTDVQNIIDLYALGETDRVYVGPGVFPSDAGEQDVYNAVAGFNERVQRVAEGISRDDPLYAGIIDPQDFGYDLRTQAFASDADRESYVQALQTRAGENIAQSFELVDQRLAIAQQLIADNPEIFASRKIQAGDDTYYQIEAGETGTRSVGVTTIGNALVDILTDPEAAATIKLAIEQAGGDISKADLRLDTLQALSVSEGIVSPGSDVPLGSRLTDASTVIPFGDTNTVLIGDDVSPTRSITGADNVQSTSAGSVRSGGYVVFFDAGTASYSVINSATGQVLASDLSRSEAREEAREANRGDAAPVPPPPPEPPVRSARFAAPPTGGNFTESFNPETGSFDVVNSDTGEIVATGLTEQQATLEAQTASVGDLSYGTGLLPTTPVARTSTVSTPAATGGNFAESFNPETGSFDVINVDTGEVVATGLTEQQAFLAAQDASIGDPSYGGLVAASAALTEEQIQALDNPAAVDDAGLVTTTIQGAGIDDERVDSPGAQPDPYEVDGANIGLTEEEIQALDNPVSPDVDPYEVDNNNRELTEEEIQAQDNPPGQTAEQQATLARAQAQATLANQQKQANQGDWRVKLRLAPGANYLYRASDGKGSQAGILQPLAVTDGVVFPYTPIISTNYRANYSNYDLTHSNYRGYFYQGSAVEEMTIQATFTAQDTYEANYLLAVIHFFKSVTKMFYGQDPERGAPPPLVYLQGLGEYQFNLHPCVVSSFNYTLPNDVDYIRARSPNINGTNLLQARQRQTISTNPFAAAWERLQNAGLPKGGVNAPPPAPTLGTNSPTYVPTKLDMTITLLPMQSREQQSQQFSLKQYANGDLLKGGFW